MSVLFLIYSFEHYSVEDNNVITGDKDGQIDCQHALYVYYTLLRVDEVLHRNTTTAFMNNIVEQQGETAYVLFTR